VSGAVGVSAPDATEVFGEPEVFGAFAPTDLPSFAPEGFAFVPLVFVSLALLSEAGAVFAGVLTGTGAFEPGFEGASLVEGAADAGVGVTAEAASPVRGAGCADFCSRAVEDFFSSFFRASFEEDDGEPPELFSSASGPTRTPSDWNACARAQGAQSATAKAAAKRYFFMLALFLACPLPRLRPSADGQRRHDLRPHGRRLPNSLFSKRRRASVRQHQHLTRAPPSRLK
jgi:hypothetical protein